MKYKKLKQKPSKEVTKFTYGDNEIEVKPYLPIADKLDLIGDAISFSADNNHFYNPGKLEVYKHLLMMKYYTNIDFGDALEDPVKVYDEISTSGLLDLFLENMKANEYDWITKTMMDTVDSIYKYQNSVLGLMEQLGKNYKELGNEALDIQKVLQDPNNLELLKDILTKLG